MGKKFSLLALVFCWLASWAQPTNPSAQAIPYSQDFSSLTGASPVYPAGWQGWDISGSLGASFPTAAPSGNRSITVTDNTITSRHVADFIGKLGIMATGSAMSTACLAINTTGYTSIGVAFDAGTQRTENSRKNVLGLQYRVGTSGTFTNVASSGYYNQMSPTNTTGTTTVGVSTISVTLPAACDNQAVVQLRWVIKDTLGSGARPGFSIDNVSVTGTASGGAAPTITSALTKTGTYGATFSYSITATNSPTSYGATGLPSGLSINTGTGDITGTPTDVGTFNVDISATNGSGTDTKTLVVIINPKSLTISGISIGNKVYDKTTTATIVGTPALVGVVGSDNVTLSGGSATFNTATVGTNKSTVVSGFVLGGTDASKYTLTQPSGLTANITPVALTVTGATATDRVYNGATTVTVGGTLAGVISGDVVTLSTTGTMANKNAGSNKAVTFAITGADAGNYTLTQPGTTVNITQAALTATANDASKVQGAANPTFTISYTGFVGGDTEANITEPTASTTAVTGSPVGTYPITLSGGAATNYTFTLVDGTLTVTTGPCLVDASGYAGWTFSGASESSGQACSGNGVLFAATGQYVITPAINNPNKLNFNKKRSSNSTAWELKVQISTLPSGPWTDVASITSITTTCAANSEIDLSSYSGTQYLRFLDNRASGTHQRGIDDITVTCLPPVACSGTPGSPTALTLSPANPDSLCSGYAASGITFSVNGSVPAGATYQWQYSTTSGSGFTDIAGADAATYNVPTGLSGNANYYRCVVTCGGSSANSNEKQIVVIALPAQPSVISGTNPACENMPGLLYSITPVAGVTYNWTVPTDWVITAGNNSTLGQITVTSDATSGSIVVTPSINGCAGPSRSLSVSTSSTIPAHVRVASSSPAFCAGVSQTFTAYPTNGGASPTYQWYKNGTLVDTNSATYTTSPSAEDRIWVEMTASGGSCVWPLVATSNLALAKNLAYDRSLVWAETFGTTGSSSVTTHTDYSHFSNSDFTVSPGIYTVDIRTTVLSPSGGSNMFFVGTGSAPAGKRVVTISNINTTNAYPNRLAFEYYKSGSFTYVDSTLFTIEISTDGTQFFPVSYPQFSGSGRWDSIVLDNVLPKASNVRLRFSSNMGGSAPPRIDNMRLYKYETASATVTAGGPTTFCAPGSVALTANPSSGNVLTYSWTGSSTANNITATTTGTYGLTITDGFGCTSTASQGVTANVCGGTQWTGNTNTNWNEVGNWSSGIPAANDDVTIPNGRPHYPVLEVDVTVGDLTVATGASFAIPADKALTVTGVLTNNGNFTVQSGGSLVQDNGSTLAGSGTFTVKRAFAGVQGSRFVGAPIYNVGVSSFGISASGTNGAQVVPIIGKCNPDSVAQNSPMGSILELKEDATPIDNCSHSLWYVKSAGTLTNARGYSMYTNGGQVLNFKGKVNNGTVTYGGLTRQSGSIGAPYTPPATQGSSTRGWHIVSNPYPSPINLKAADLTAMGFDAQIQMWQPISASSGNWIASDPLDPAGLDIAVAQGFQIRKATVGGTADFSLDNTVRKKGNPTFHKNGPRQHYLNVALAGSNGELDATMVYFYQGATDAFDSELDANRLSPSWSVPILYTVAASERMRYNAYEELNPGETKSVPLGVHSAVSDSFSLVFSDVATLTSAGITATLEDTKEQTFTPISESLNYSFTRTFGEPNERFVLHFNKANEVSGIHTAQAGKVQVYPNPSAGLVTIAMGKQHGFEKIQLFDVAGKVVLSIPVAAQDENKMVDIAMLPSGVYTLRATGSSHFVSKLIKE